MKLWVFPEGTRRNTGEIHEFKKGAFRIAIQGQIPIVPIVFSKNYFMCSKNKIFDDGMLATTNSLAMKLILVHFCFVATYFLCLFL